MEWRNRYGRKIFSRGWQVHNGSHQSDCMDCIKCVAAGPECGKGLPPAVRTCRQTVSCICEGRNTIEGRRQHEDFCKLPEEPETGTIFLQDEEACSIMEGEQYAPGTGQTQGMCPV